MAEKQYRSLDQAARFAEAITGQMPAGDWYFMGSYRRLMHLRGRERKAATIGDLDILVVTPSGTLEGFPFPESFTPDRTNGPRSAQGHVRAGRARMRADFWACTRRHVGGFLLYGTGPQNYCIHLRSVAKGKRMKLNQGGLYGPDGSQLDDSTEEKIHELLGVKFLSPYQRESWAGPDMAKAVLVVVKSRSGGKPHHVYLDGPKSSCNCAHYTFRRTPCWAVGEAQQRQARKQHRKLVAA